MLKEDDVLIKEYKVKLDQSARNIQQGEMGRSLAQDKINAIKQAMLQLDTNIKSETAHI